MTGSGTETLSLLPQIEVSELVMGKLKIDKFVMPV